VKRFKAAVIGGTGYGGAELIRRLLIHPDDNQCLMVVVQMRPSPRRLLSGRLEAQHSLLRKCSPN